MIRESARFIAGLLTFVAMVLSVAEGAWASMCGPTMELSAPATASRDETPAGHDCMTTHQNERDTREVPDCPFGPAGATQGCTVGASLPAESAVEITPTPEGAELVPAFETERHLLLGSTLFHPPKA